METSYSNDFIDLTVLKEENCIVTYKIKAKKNLLQKAKKSAIKKIAKEVSLPGFRKGKAPDAVIETNYASALKREAESNLSSLAFEEARKFDRTFILQTEGAIQVKLESLSEDEGEFAYHLSTLPEVPNMDDIGTITIKAEPYALPTQEEIDSEVTRLAKLFANYTQINNRSVQEGDFVVINAYDLANATQEPVLKGSRIDLSKEGSRTEWLKEALIDMNVGETKEVTTRPNIDESEEFKRDFVEKQLRLELISIEQPDIPTLDDEFAKKLGLESIETLRKEVKNRTEHESKTQYMQNLRDQLSQILVERYSFPIPQVILERELAHRMQRLNATKKGLAEWQALSKEGQDQKREEVKQKALEAIRLYFIVQHLIKKYQLSPPASFQEEMKEIALRHRQEGISKAELEKQQQKIEEEQNARASVVMMEVVLNTILEKELNLLPL